MYASLLCSRGRRRARNAASTRPPAQQRRRRRRRRQGGGGGGAEGKARPSSTAQVVLQCFSVLQLMMALLPRACSRVAASAAARPARASRKAAGGGAATGPPAATAYSRRSRPQMCCTSPSLRPQEHPPALESRACRPCWPPTRTGGRPAGAMTTAAPTCPQLLGHVALVVGLCSAPARHGRHEHHRARAAAPAAAAGSTATKSEAAAAAALRPPPKAPPPTLRRPRPWYAPRGAAVRVKQQQQQQQQQHQRRRPPHQRAGRKGRDRRGVRRLFFEATNNKTAATGGSSDSIRVAFSKRDDKKHAKEKRNDRGGGGGRRQTRPLDGQNTARPHLIKPCPPGGASTTISCPPSASVCTPAPSRSGAHARVKSGLRTEAACCRPCRAQRDEAERRDERGTPSHQGVELAARAGLVEEVDVKVQRRVLEHPVARAVGWRKGRRGGGRSAAPTERRGPVGGAEKSGGRGEQLQNSTEGALGA